MWRHAISRNRQSTAASVQPLVKGVSLGGGEPSPFRFVSLRLESGVRFSARVRVRGGGVSLSCPSLLKVGVLVRVRVRVRVSVRVRVRVWVGVRVRVRVGVGVRVRAFCVSYA